jgi:hypothetical protein
MTGQLVIYDTPVSSTNKTDDIIEILLKMALITINQTKPSKIWCKYLN